jgi:hypothetical protein
MAEPISAAADFNLDLAEIIEEAYERCGAEVRSGYDFRTARRSLNLLLLEWANRGINLWTIEEGSIPLVAGTAAYNLPVDTVDLIEFGIRTGAGQGQSDLPLARMSMSTYSAIPAKNSPGRPNQIWVDRRSGATDANLNPVPPRAVLWPVPDVSATYTLVYWRLRRMKSAGDGMNGQDIPFRMLPALVAGLAYYLSMKIPGAEVKTPLLKGDYDDVWLRAADEDRDRSALRLVPRVSRP